MLTIRVVARKKNVLDFNTQEALCFGVDGRENSISGADGACFYVCLVAMSTFFAFEIIDICFGQQKITLNKKVVLQSLLS